MNPAYFTTRFRAPIPEGGWPVRFAVVTACNPHGRILPQAANRVRTEEFRGALEKGGIPFFPVTGGSPDFEHSEEGFGLTGLGLLDALAWGRRWEQVAIFWIEDGEVSLVSCEQPTPVLRFLGPWVARLEVTKCGPH